MLGIGESFMSMILSFMIDIKKQISYPPLLFFNFYISPRLILLVRVYMCIDWLYMIVYIPIFTMV